MKCRWGGRRYRLRHRPPDQDRPVREYADFPNQCPSRSKNLEGLDEEIECYHPSPDATQSPKLRNRIGEEQGGEADPELSLSELVSEVGKQMMAMTMMMMNRGQKSRSEYTHIRCSSQDKEEGGNPQRKSQTYQPRKTNLGCQRMKNDSDMYKHRVRNA